MRTPVVMLMLLLLAGAALTWSHASVRPGPERAADAPAPAEAQVGRFIALPVYIDAGDAPLAAYQFELSDRDGRSRVVGVENGEHIAFADAPYFDRDAVARGQADRIIVAAYSTRPAGALPTGRTRVATVHLHVIGNEPPQWQLTLIRAGSPAGEPLEATITLEQPDTTRE